MVKPFHQWQEEMADSIVDNSTFSKQMPCKNILQEIFYRALDDVPGKDVINEETAAKFVVSLTREIGELLGEDEYLAICTDDAYKYWFHRLKERFFK